MFILPISFAVDWTVPLQFPATSPLPPNHFPLVQATSKAPFDLDPHENSRSAPAPATTQSSAAPTTFRARIHRLSTWWPIRPGHPPPPVVDVPLAWGELRHAAAGAPPTDDDDLDS
ncbi:uncharacterized protein EDB91DRAFT_1077871 [Suillus paluster]|uniref:uncharacterized protein n=1 Tax=Suillus paluster TaxID=48578 RepID=UPI001B871B52|nr:uncharacterized protein EDB91DRAFT_1077871 [Suillus paluster]KAG1752492.1 hypothetical protein EDB91DRAFT_1077871 [Suillus paluster]